MFQSASNLATAMYFYSQDIPLEADADVSRSGSVRLPANSIYDEETRYSSRNTAASGGGALCLGVIALT